jgi:hypothetical protein
VKLVRMMVLTIAKFSLAISPVSAEVIKWSGWGEDVFSRAKAEQRFVILDLEAVWSCRPWPIATFPCATKCGRFLGTADIVALVCWPELVANDPFATSASAFDCASLYRYGAMGREG